MTKKLIALAFVCLAVVPIAHAQKVAVKTNLLYDATSTLNLGVEFGLAKKWTLDVSGNYNPWTFSDNHKFKHWLVQPEARYWFCEKFNGQFLGLHAHGGEFNVGGTMPWGLKNSTIQANRYEGWALGAGISYGYHWMWSSRWSMEFTVGVGYAYLDYGQYRCEKCGDKIADKNKHYVGPTKAGITLIYMIK